jgi:hypothetical protein
VKLDRLARSVHQLVAMVREFEALRDRVLAGLKRAKAQGVRLGRPRAVVDVLRARAMLADGKSLRQVAGALHGALATLARINKDGHVVIQPACEWAYPFSGDLAQISLGGTFDEWGDLKNAQLGCIDRSGRGGEHTLGFRRLFRKPRGESCPNYAICGLVRLATG